MATKTTIHLSRYAEWAAAAQELRADKALTGAT